MGSFLQLHLLPAGPSNLSQREHPSAIGKHISSMAFNVSLGAFASVPFTVYVCVSEGLTHLNLSQGRDFTPEYREVNSK